MPFNQRLKIFEAIKGSTIHQSLATPSSEVDFSFSFLLRVETGSNSYITDCYDEMPELRGDRSHPDLGPGSDHSPAGDQHQDTGYPGPVL